MHYTVPHTVRWSLFNFSRVAGIQSLFCSWCFGFVML